MVSSVYVCEIIVKERVSSRTFWTIDKLYAEQSDMVHRSKVQRDKELNISM